MKKQTKAMSLALSAALAASSFAALAVTASAAGDISLDGEKTFDAVRITYKEATATDAALTVGGDSYTVPAGTTSTVVNVAEDTKASTIGLSNYNPNTTEIKLLDYSKIALNTTTTAPYLEHAWAGGDQTENLVLSGNVTAKNVKTVNDKVDQNNATAGRFANMFNGFPDWSSVSNTNTVVAALYKPQYVSEFDEDGNAKTTPRVDNGWYVLNFDLGSDTEIAKIKTYTAANLISGYTIGTYNDASDITATEIFSEITKSDYMSNRKSYGQFTLQDTTKTSPAYYYLDTVVNKTTDKLQFKFDDFQGDMVSLLEFELYTYADVYTVEEQTITYTSDAVDLGKAVTFNKLTADESANWETSTDGETWTAYTDGADTTAQYIRTTSEESTPSVPAFTLSWEGNLAKYAGEGYNGASIGGVNHGGSNLSILYDEIKDYNDANSKDESVLIYANYSKHNIQFNLNAPAAIESVQAYWVSSGVMYPYTYKIETSNKGTVWNTTNLTIAEKNEANKKAYTDGVHALNVTAAIVNIDYIQSYRAFDGRNGDIVRTTEIEIPGSVEVASYNGTVSFPTIPDDEQPVVEPTTAATTKSEIFNTEDDAAAISFATDAIELDADKSVSKFKWIVKNDANGSAEVEASKSTTFTGGNIQLALIITGTEAQLKTLTDATLVIE